MIVFDTGVLIAAANRRDGNHTRCVAFFDQHATADASVVACAERIGAHRVATLNHRDFTVVRPTHTDALTLVS